MRFRWIVAFEHPYYPEIHLVDSEDEAKALVEQLKDEHHAEDGIHDGFIYYASMAHGILEEVKTHY